MSKQEYVLLASSATTAANKVWNEAQIVAPMSRTVKLDQSYTTNQSPVFDNASDALAELRGLVSNGTPAVLRVGFQTDDTAYAPASDAPEFFNQYVTGYSEDPNDSNIVLLFENVRGLMQYGTRSELPGTLPEGVHFLVTSDGTNAVSPPELYVGPDGGGSPELATIDRDTVAITGGSIEGVIIKDSNIYDKSGDLSYQEADSYSIITNPPSGRFIILRGGIVNSATAAFTGFVAKFLITVDSSPTNAEITKLHTLGISITATTGALTGTSGTGWTVSVDSNGELYIENNKTSDHTMDYKFGTY